jgi:hypothetical protein
MSTQKEESVKPASEQQPKATKCDELEEKQLDEASGGYGGGTYLPPSPPPRG